MKATSFFMSFFLLATVVFAQESDKTKIQAIVHLIEIDSTFNIKIFTYDSTSITEIKKVKLWGYLKNGMPYKIIETENFDSCSTRVMYYFLESHLIYVTGRHRVFESFDSLGYVRLKELPGWGFSFYFDKDQTVFEYTVGHCHCNSKYGITYNSEILAKSKKNYVLLKD